MKKYVVSSHILENEQIDENDMLLLAKTLIILMQYSISNVLKYVQKYIYIKSTTSSVKKVYFKPAHSIKTAYFHYILQRVMVWILVDFLEGKQPNSKVMVCQWHNTLEFSLRFTINYHFV